jgi:hypothetical protein
VTNDVERRRALADTVLAAVDRLPRETAVIMARALMLAPSTLRGIGGAFDAHLNGSPRLARMQVAYQLHRLARDGEVLEQLRESGEEPWLSLRAALEQLRDDELESMLPLT